MICAACIALSLRSTIVSASSHFLEELSVLTDFVNLDRELGSKLLGPPWAAIQTDNDKFMAPGTRVRMNPIEAKDGALDGKNRLIMIDSSRHTKDELHKQLKHWLSLQDSGRPFRFRSHIRRARAAVKAPKLAKPRKKSTAGKRRARHGDESESDAADSETGGSSDDEDYNQEDSGSDDDGSDSDDSSGSSDSDNDSNGDGETKAKERSLGGRAHSRRDKAQETEDTNLPIIQERSTAGDGSTTGDIEEVEGELVFGTAASARTSRNSMAVVTGEDDEEEFSFGGHFSLHDVPSTALARYKAMKSLWNETDYQDSLDLFRELWVCRTFCNANFQHAYHRFQSLQMEMLPTMAIFSNFHPGLTGSSRTNIFQANFIATRDPSSGSFQVQAVMMSWGAS